MIFYRIKNVSCRNGRKTICSPSWPVHWHRIVWLLQILLLHFSKWQSVPIRKSATRKREALARTPIENVSCSIDVLVTVSFVLTFIISIAGSGFLMYFATRQLGEALEPEMFETVIEGKGRVEYYMHFYSETHARAAARCQRGNMKLLSITSQQEDVYVTTELRKRTRWAAARKNGTSDEDRPAVAYWWLSAYEKKTLVGGAPKSFQWESTKLSMDYSNFCEDEKTELFTPGDRNKARPLAKLVINSDKEVQGKVSGCWSQRNRAASYDWEGQRSPFICELIDG